MRVLIDATNLPWAVPYYKMFPFEPSRHPIDDIRFNARDIRELKNPTLLDVLKQMLVAAREGEKEVMIVAHGNPRGLAMSVAPGVPPGADASTLRWVLAAGKAFDLLDTNVSLNRGEGMLFGWANLMALFNNSADETAVARDSPRFAAEFMQAGTVDKACAAARDIFIKQAVPKLLQSLKTNEKALREVVKLTREVRAVQFKRIEVRSCNTGQAPGQGSQNDSGLTALRSYFDCERLMAPKVHTFYVAVNAHDTRAAQLADQKDRASGRWRFFFGAPIVLPPSGTPRGVTPFFDDVVYGPLYFMLKVTPVNTPKYTSDSARLDASVIQPWVERYIHPAARYPGSGPFSVGGLDAPTAQNEPYTLPQDPNYRGLIAVASNAGTVER